MQLEVQKSLAIYISYFLTFCVGLDNAVVIPTLLEHLRMLGIPHEIILGLTIAGYGFINSLSLKLMTHFMNNAYNVRWLLICCCACFISGGFSYSYTQSWWPVLIARWLCGFGSGIWAVINADIKNSSLDDEFHQLLWRLKLSLVLGWICAPIFSVALLSIETQHVSKSAIPGLMTSTIFIACGILTIIGWFDLGKTLRYCRLRQSISLAYERVSVSSRKSYGTVSPKEEVVVTEEYAHIYGLRSAQEGEPSSTRVNEKATTYKTDDPGKRTLRRCSTALTISDEILESAEVFMGQLERSPPETLPSPDIVSNTAEGSPSEIDFTSARHQTQKRFFLMIDVTNWLGPPFLTAFLFSGIQTMYTPLTNKFFNFGGMENALIQLVLGVLGVSIKIITAKFKLSPKINQLSGCLLTAFSFGWMLMLCPAFELGLGSLPSFCAGLLGVSLGCGMLGAMCSFDDTPQDTTWVCWTSGLLLGPLWTAGTISQPRVLFGGQLTLVLVAAATTII